MAPKVPHVLGAFLFFFVIQPFIAQSRTLKPTTQSFKFLQNLEGSYKGQTVKGLQELKRYLNAFVYYNDPHNSNLTDDFDDVLESALKTYQKNYNLKVTGILDSSTIKEMMIKRCGVPDIINRPTKEATSESKQGHKSNKFHTVSHYAFPNEAPQGTKADIEIGFYSGDHGDSYPFDGPGNVLAHAFSPTDGRFHYDADENWSTNPGSHQVDLESVAVHEIGHLLGLAHSMDQNAIMFAKIPPGAIKRDLRQDDINGIRALYSKWSTSTSMAQCLLLQTKQGYNIM